MGTNTQDSPRESHNSIQLPAWLPSVFEAISKHGPFAAIAAFLVWNLVNGNAAELRAHAEKLEAHAAESRDALVRQLSVLSQICANTAKTDDERAACWRAIR